MGMRITTNVAAINSQRNLIGSQRQMQNSMSQLASGSRINRSADDAAGLAISENMKAQLRSSAQARRNANDGISMVQVAEGGLNEVSAIVTRLRELGIQASSDTIGDKERSFIDTEVQQLKLEMERIANTTAWNTTKLLDGTTPVFDFQVGLYATEDDVISFDTSKNVATLDALGLADVDFKSKDGGVFHRVRTLNRQSLEKAKEWDITAIHFPPRFTPHMNRITGQPVYNEDILRGIPCTKAEFLAAQKEFIRVMNSTTRIEPDELPF